MLSFSLQNLNLTFYLTSKVLNLYGGTLLLFCLLSNTLFLLFFAVQFLIGSARLIFLHFNLQKHHLYLAFSFLSNVDFFCWLILRFLNAKYIHFILVLCWESPKTQLLHWRKRFLNWKYQRYLVCCLLFCKYVLSVAFRDFNLKRH